MPPTRTALHQLAEALLGRSLDTFVDARLSEGIGWRKIADDLAKQTNGLVVSHETLRSWYADRAERGDAA